MAPVVTMKQLLEAGVHFGHQTRRWNPKMKRFIFGERNGIYIIDLQQTLRRIESAYSFVRDLVAAGGTVLFIGTKKQAQDPIQSYAEKCGMPYINERWLGGMLTNFETISKRVAKMQEYQRMRSTGEFEAMPKKEALLIGRELEKLERNLQGIRNMEKLPQAVFILDTKKEHIAVTEANKLGVPIVAVVDTNCDPDLIQYVIPGNDDAIRSGTLMCRIIADAVDEGRFIASRRSGGGTGAGPAPGRSAEEEARVAAQQSEARRQAALAAQEREARLAGVTPAPDTVSADTASTDAVSTGAGPAESLEAAPAALPIPPPPVAVAPDLVDEPFPDGPAGPDGPVGPDAPVGPDEPALAGATPPAAAWEAEVEVDPADQPAPEILEAVSATEAEPSLAMSAPVLDDAVVDDAVADQPVADETPADETPADETPADVPPAATDTAPEA
ncbi:hypothetical protein BH18ACT4_BH18ACT4_08620 [soil metagenome]